MSADQRVWWERGDDARREDERAGNVAADATAEQLRAGLDLGSWFDNDLADLTDEERAAALAAAEHGYVEGRAGGYGQPSWLNTRAPEITRLADAFAHDGTRGILFLDEFNAGEVRS